MGFPRLRVLADIWRYTMATKKIWLLLLMIFLLLVGLLILFTESPAIMPFIYTLF